MSLEHDAARCGAHPTAVAAGSCARCGRFACEGCARVEQERFLCVECLELPAARLTPSPRAMRAFWLGLIGLHGPLFLLPVAFWLARQELAAIRRGESQPAGTPWARGAVALCGVAAAGWLIVAMVVWSRLER